MEPFEQEREGYLIVTSQTSGQMDQSGTAHPSADGAPLGAASEQLASSASKGSSCSEQSSGDETATDVETASTTDIETSCSMEDVKCTNSADEEVKTPSSVSQEYIPTDKSRVWSHMRDMDDLEAKLRGDPLFELAKAARTHRPPLVNSGILNVDMKDAKLWYSVKFEGEMKLLTLSTSIEGIKTLHRDLKLADAESKEEAKLYKTAAVLKGNQCSFELADLPQILDGLREARSLNRKKHLRASLSHLFISANDTVLEDQTVRCKERDAIGHLLVFLPSSADGGELKVWQADSEKPTYFDVSSMCRTFRVAWVFVPMNAKFSFSKVVGGRLTLCYHIAVKTSSIRPFEQDLSRTECWKQLQSIMSEPDHHGRVLASVLTEKPLPTSRTSETELIGFNAVLWKAAHSLGLRVARIKIKPRDNAKDESSESESSDDDGDDLNRARKASCHGSPQERRPDSEVREWSDVSSEDAESETCSERSEADSWATYQTPTSDSSLGTQQETCDSSDNESEYTSASSEASSHDSSDTDGEASLDVNKGSGIVDTSKIESSEYYKARTAAMEAGRDRDLKQQADYEKSMRVFEVFAPQSIKNYEVFESISPLEATFKRKSHSRKVAFDQALRRNVSWLQPDNNQRRQKTRPNNGLVYRTRRINVGKEVILIYIPAPNEPETEPAKTEEPPQKKVKYA